MNLLLSDRLQALNSPQWFKTLRGIKRGIEKESLRTDKNGMIAKTQHPAGLGSSLMHPFLTTDYSEALLEFITPPSSDLEEPFKILTELHQFTYQNLGEEILWANSMPCRLPTEEEIPIAEYGTSNLGRLKHIYRQGLGLRYGRRMQTIAGIHYNFSLPQDFWEKYHALLGNTQPLQDFISEQYLGLIRNCLRYSWILPLLFGASPALGASFLKKKVAALKEWDSSTYIGLFSTSLRLSDLGYHNRAQDTVPISHNTFAEFLQTMHQAVHTPYLEYKRIGVQKGGEYHQLSDCIFQVEDEHYALVRPKRVSKQDERMYAALMQNGIEYIEVRALDINPFIPIGIEPNTVYVLDAYLVACLLMESPPLNDVENKRIAYNHTQVVNYGRQSKLTILDATGNIVLLQNAALELLEHLCSVATVLDKTYNVINFSEACKIARSHIIDPEKLPSARIIKEMNERKCSYFDFVWSWSLQHRNYFSSNNLSPSIEEHYKQLAEISQKAQLELEQGDTLSLDEYLRHYLEV